MAKNTEIETGFAMKIRIPKISKNTVSIPNFILIDGGKGQLSSVINVFTEHGWEYKNSAFYYGNINIILCSLAKKEEEIFFPYESNPRYLANNSEGSYLLQRLRDESHRFAITFNRNNRIKNSMKSELDEVPGIGQVTKKKLMKTFGSVGAIKRASLENLQLCVGAELAKNIQEYFNSKAL